MPVDLREANSDGPWKEIAGTRDRLSHGYDDLDYRVLWDAVQTDIPLLLETIEITLKNLSSD